ncbi:MAG: penicillin-binding protein activator, partial [Gammaproteobacteria bacterium]
MTHETSLEYRSRNYITMLHNISLRLLIILGFLLPLLYGCGPVTTKPSPDTSLELEQQAHDFLLAENFAAAAEEYLRLADQHKNYSGLFTLKAAGVYIEGNIIDHAKLILSTIDQHKLTTTQQTQKNILHAKIALLENNPIDALALLSIDLPAEATRSLLVTYYETRSLALEKGKQFLDAAKDRILLDSYLDSDEKLNENHKMLWRVIAHMEIQDINDYRTTSSEILVSWLELAIINKTILHNKDNLVAAIDLWNQRYPDHPALIEIVPNMFTISEQMGTLPGKIALLLPFNSKYNEASNAIREGFMAAWYATENEKPIIQIYNADAQNILHAYQLAIDEGAEFIVGPLEKAAVKTLISNGEPLVRTMVLNHYENDFDPSVDTDQTSAIPRLIQFSLSPEDEARQVAERAWFDGNANALIITPDTPWGERILNAFTIHWEQLGGNILEHVTLVQNSKDYSAPVKQILNIDNSEQRVKILKSKLNRKIFTEPRRRLDADFI